MGEFDVNLKTLEILAWSKVILFFYIITFLYFIYKHKSAIWYVILNTIAFVLFYLNFSLPLNNMLWGNVGDEVFVSGFLGKVLLDNLWQDFYYAWLPNFYPPLYFWVTGLISRPFASNAISAAKIGLAGSLLLWFLGVYLWQKLFWNNISKIKSNIKNIPESTWFWFLLPFIYFSFLDFDTIILKPYESLSALAGVILIAIISRSFYLKSWSYKHYIFISLSGGVLFLMYYFWWAVFIPSLFLLALLSKDRFKNFKRITLFGLIILAISSIFLIPLIYSYFTYGIENNQAIHFIPSDFFIFVPWKVFSLRGLMYLLGLFGLIFFSKKSFVKSSLIVFIFTYLYQFFNIFYYLFGNRPIQPSKHFLFLGTAAISLGLTYLLIYLYNNKIKKLGSKYIKSLIYISFFIILTRLPFVYFIDDKVILKQIRLDLEKPVHIIRLAEDIKYNIPDYSNRTWLSSGSSHLTAYLPLSYYIANNIHFSHHASMYTQRMEEIYEMSNSSTPEDFMEVIDKGYPNKIDSIILYNTNDTEDYTLYFWHDNFPNGGKDVEVKLPKNLIIEYDWDKVYNKNNWVIFLRK